MGIPLIACSLILFKILDESPRHLVARHKFDEARFIFNKISVFNDRPEFKFK
jgi:hypothetical protein